MNKPKFTSIYSYVFKEVLASFGIAFLFLFFIFFVNAILLMAENILSKHVPLWDVILLLICNMPQIIALSIPFAALIGALMAIGRLSSDNEILAFRCSGVSLSRIFVPLIVGSLLFSCTSFLFNDYFLSLGFLEMSKIYRTVFSRNPGLELEPYSAKVYESKVLITGSIKKNIISDIIIIDKTADNKKRVITASNAQILQNKKQEGVISLKLNNVFSDTTEQGKPGDYEYEEAESMEYNILVQKIIGPIAITPTAREMTVYDVWKAVGDKNRDIDFRKREQAVRLSELELKLSSVVRVARESVDAVGRISGESELNVRKVYDDIQHEKTRKIEDASVKTFIVELHKKFALPFSCVVFILFAFPVGLLAKKSGRTLGFMIGVLMSAFYWGMLFISYRMGYQAELDPFFIIWFPNLVILAIGIGLFVVRFKR